MHVQRVHYGKLAALIFIVTGFLLLLYRSLPDPRTSLIGNAIINLLGIEHILQRQKIFIQNQSMEVLHP